MPGTGDVRQIGVVLWCCSAWRTHVRHSVKMWGMMSSSPPENDADAVGTGLQSGDVDLRHAHAMSMDVTTLYTCLWLRSAVFHGEQRCTEPDLDGRELEPTTVLVWASVGGRPVGTLRILDDQDHLVIGRVAVDVASRGLHIGRRMMDLALEIAGADGREVALYAQSCLENWYRDFGFVVTGPHFEEAGIDHVPMVLRR